MKQYRPSWVFPLNTMIRKMVFIKATPNETMKWYDQCRGIWANCVAAKGEQTAPSPYRRAHSLAWEKASSILYCESATHHTANALVPFWWQNSHSVPPRSYYFVRPNEAYQIISCLRALKITWSEIPQPSMKNATQKTGNGSAGAIKMYPIIWRAEPTKTTVEIIIIAFLKRLYRIQEPIRRVVRSRKDKYQFKT